jgi:hypothetical protein
MSKPPSPKAPKDNGRKRPRKPPPHGDLDGKPKDGEERLSQFSAMPNDIAKSNSDSVDIEARAVKIIGGDYVEGDLVHGNKIENQNIYNVGSGAVLAVGPYGAIASTNNEAPSPIKLPKPLTPPEPQGFLDRSNELAKINAMIENKQMVIVYGPDGVGKSYLLRKAANSEAASALPDGVVWIDSIDGGGKALSLDDIAQRAFDALHASRLKVDATSAPQYLAKVQALVILDGVSLSRDMLRRLSDIFQNSPVLIALPGPLIDSSEPRRIKLEGLPRAEAIELLATKSEKQVDKDNREHFDGICELLADAPLAIVTVANVMENRPLTPSDAFKILDSMEPEPGEQIQAGINRAYRLVDSKLNDAEQLVLHTAAALPGKSIDPNMLVAILSKIAGKLIGEKQQWGVVIENLKKRGLLHANSPRLRIDPGFRPLALADTDETTVQDQLIAELRHDAMQEKMHDWHYCEDELGNILGAIQWATEHERWNDVIELGRAIDPYVMLHGLWDAWSTTLTQILQAARSVDDEPNKAWALHQLGSHALVIGQTAHANKLLYQALVLRRALGDTSGMARTRHNLDVMTHGAQWAGQDLTLYNFAFADLAQADLRYANLQGVSLEEANLAGAILRGAKLQKANLASAYLGKADLRQANLQDADLTNAYVTNVDLSETNLTNADLSRANLNGSQITEEQLKTVKCLAGAIMPDGSVHP